MWVICVSDVEDKAVKSHTVSVFTFVTKTVPIHLNYGTDRAMSTWSE